MKLALIPLALFLGACTITKYVPHQRPAPVFVEPAPATQQEFEWVVITRENALEMIAELEQNGGEVVLFAVTPDGYNTIQLNAAEMRRYINQQQSVVDGYRMWVAEGEQEEPRRRWFRLERVEK